MRLFSAECLQDPFVRKRIKNFDSEIKRRWKLDDEANVQQSAHTFPSFDPNIVPRENDEEIGPILDGPHDTDSFTPEEYSQDVSSQIKMPLGDEEVTATVKKCKRNNSGKPIGIYNENPLLNTRLYKVDLRNGAVE